MNNSTITNRRKRGIRTSNKSNRSERVKTNSTSEIIIKKEDILKSEPIVQQESLNFLNIREIKTQEEFSDLFDEILGKFGLEPVEKTEDKK